MVEKLADHSASQIDGDFGDVNPEEIVWRTTREDKKIADFAGDYGDIQSSLSDLPRKYRTINRTVEVKVKDRYKKPLIIGSAVFAGVTGGILFKRYVGRER